MSYSNIVSHAPIGYWIDDLPCLLQCPWRSSLLTSKDTCCPVMCEYMRFQFLGAKNI